MAPVRGNRCDRGASALEYTAVLVLLAVVAGAVTAALSTSGAAVIDRVNRAVCTLLGREDCGGDTAEEGGTESEAASEPAPHYPYDPCGLGPPDGWAPVEPGDRGGPVSTQGQRRGADLAEILDGHHGLPSPYGFVVDMGDPHFNLSPMEVSDLAELYPDLVGFFDDNAANLDNEIYAAALVNELGPSGVRSLMDLANTYGMGTTFEENYETDLNRVHGEYVEPLATLLSAADRSGRLDEEVRQAMVDTSTPTAEEVMDALADPDLFPEEELHIDNVDEDVYQQISWELAVQRQRANAVLLDAGDFSSRTTADLASGILHADPPKFDTLQLTEGFGTPEFFDGGEHHPSLADSRWTAFHALAEDPNAATLFYADEDNAALSEEWFGDEHYSFDAPFNLMTEWRLSTSPDEVTEMVQQTVTDSLEAQCT